MGIPNQSYAERCRNLSDAIQRLSALGVMVRQVEIDATPPIVWVFACPALYRTFGGSVNDLGRSNFARTKSADCHGCEVRWLETHAFSRARQAMRAKGGHHAHA